MRCPLYVRYRLVESFVGLFTACVGAAAVADWAVGPGVRDCAGGGQPANEPETNERMVIAGLRLVPVAGRLDGMRGVGRVASRACETGR